MSAIADGIIHLLMQFIFFARQASKDIRDRPSIAMKLDELLKRPILDCPPHIVAGKTCPYQIADQVASTLRFRIDMIFRGMETPCRFLTHDHTAIMTLPLLEMGEIFAERNGCLLFQPATNAFRIPMDH